MSILEEAIVFYLGKRCKTFNADCLCCKAWKEYDDLHIAGLREAAEITYKESKTDDTAWAAYLAILARIAELEQKP